MFFSAICFSNSFNSQRVVRIVEFFNKKYLFLLILLRFILPFFFLTVSNPSLAGSFANGKGMKGGFQKRMVEISFKLRENRKEASSSLLLPTVLNADTGINLTH